MADKMYRELRSRALENLRTHLKWSVDDGALDRITAAMIRNADKLEQANDKSGAVEMLRQSVGKPLEECFDAINAALNTSRRWGLASRASKLKETNFRANVKEREGKMTAEELAEMVGDMIGGGPAYLLRRPNGALVVRSTTSSIRHDRCELICAYDITSNYPDILADIKEAMA